MNSNSNFNITKVTVDPISQQITNLEINGKSFESGEGPSGDYEVWYVGNAELNSEKRVAAVNANPYDANPAITHYLVAYDPENTGNMKWKKYEAYGAMVSENISGGGLYVSFALDAKKETYGYLYTNGEDGTMSKAYIKKEDIIDS